jgi:hypothetical protein
MVDGEPCPGIGSWRDLSRFPEDPASTALNRVFPGMGSGPRGGLITRYPGLQKLFGSQSNIAVAMLKNTMAAVRITILSRFSSHFSPTPHRKSTMA